MERESEKTGAPSRPSREQPSMVSYASLQALRLKLGHILLDAGFITPDALQEALEIAKTSQAPTGKVLVTLKYLDEQTLQAALLAQSLIAEGVVDQNTAVEALRVSRTEKIPFAQALEQTETRSASDSSELDELLIGSRLVEPQMYEEAKRAAKGNKIPLGRALVLSSGITFYHLNSALECISLMRSGRMNKEQALAVLSEMKRNNVEIDEAMRRSNLSPKTTLSRIKLGDILTAGKLINERENLAAVERALLEKRLLGDVLVESGLVSKDVVQSALTLQNLASRGVLNRSDAVRALRKIVDEKKSFTAAAHELGLFKDDPQTSESLLELLFKSGLARPDDVPIALKQQANFQMDAVKALLASGCISDLAYQAGLDCVAVVKAGELSFDQAVIALQACDRNRSTLAETMNDLGIVATKKATTEKPLVSGIGRPTITPPVPEVQPLMQGTAEDEPPDSPWTKVFESKLLIGNFILGAIAMCALLTYCHESWKPVGICVILFIVSVNQFAMGKTWQQLDAARKREKEERISSAKEGVSRLKRK